MKKHTKPTEISDTSHHAVDYKTPVSADSNNLLRDSAVDRVYGINSTPPTFIDAKDGVQGGRYCFRDTRVPISSLKQVIEGGVTYNKMAETLKKYFNLNIRAEEIESALREYDQIINQNE